MAGVLALQFESGSRVAPPDSGSLEAREKTLPMEIAWQDWLGMIIRWLHLATGIAWIGTSFFFIWLDLSLRRRGEMPDGVQGESWLVHGGGFYHAQKYSVAPEHLPAELHWFKYEAYFTWLSGFALLGVMYYWGAESFLIDPDRTPFSPSVAILVSLVFLGGGWLAYDGLCRSPVGQHTGLLAGAVFLLVTIAGWGLTQLFSDRAAFLHVGAVIGTIMSANVFFIIIPNQKKVVTDLKAGRTPAPALGLQAKQRSLHNNYLTLPVLLLMVSAHYPVLFSGAATWGWLVIALILLIGGVVRHFFNTLHTGGRGWALLWQWPVAACIGLGLAVFLTALTPKISVAPVSDARALAIIDRHCVSCHSATPANRAFAAAPAGVRLERPEDLRRFASRILHQTVDSRAMPLGNTTGMTDTERAELGAWLRQ